MEADRHPCKRCGKPTLTSILDSRDGACVPCSRTAWEARLRGSLAQAGRSLYPTAAMLLSNKSQDYHEHVLSCAQAIADFFTESHLAMSDLHARFVAAPEEFSFTSDDLSAAGKAFTQVAFNRWLDSNDRWSAHADRSTEGYKTTLRRAYERFRHEGGRTYPDLPKASDPTH